MILRLTLLAALVTVSSSAFAEDPIVIDGPEQARVDLNLPNGGLELARGVANIQVFRAARGAPDLADGNGWTYHHHVDLAAWKGRLYLAWNSTEKDEDVWPSRELYSTSADGFSWSPPQELFPIGTSTGSRMYFFHAPNGRMLAIAGLRTTHEQMTERKKGALVVREIRSDHALGPVHVLRPPNDPANAKSLPRHQDAADKQFVEGCEQLLANKPFLEQADYGYLLDDAARMKWHDANTWPADEPSRGEFNRFGKAIAFFHRKDGALVAVMKWGWVLVSRDDGHTWSPPVRPPTFVSGMAKAWPQRTADGRYAIAYNPDLQRRYPLVVVHGDDGRTFRDMRVLHGEVPPTRYPGLYKSPGPQYVRGISEWSSDGSFADAKRALWVCYSVNKEDIWVSRVSLPIGAANDGVGEDDDARAWNTYSPKWAPASITRDGGNVTLVLDDRDPVDFARATNVFAKPVKTIDVSFDVRVGDATTEPLYIDLTGPRGCRVASISISPARLSTTEWNTVRATADCVDQSVTIRLPRDVMTTLPFAQPADVLVGLALRTGDRAALVSAERDRPTAASRYEIRNIVIKQ